MTTEQRTAISRMTGQHAELAPKFGTEPAPLAPSDALDTIEARCEHTVYQDGYHSARYEAGFGVMSTDIEDIAQRAVDVARDFAANDAPDPPELMAAYWAMGYAAAAQSITPH